MNIRQRTEERKGKARPLRENETVLMGGLRDKTKTTKECRSKKERADLPARGWGAKALKGKLCNQGTNDRNGG